MLKKEEYKGYFFTPENPDKKISGILHFFPNEKIRLELIGGCLSGKTDFLFCRHEELKAIFGVVKTPNTVSKVTLLNCHGSNGKSSNYEQNCDICIVNYTCNYLLFGRHLEDIGNVVFNKIRVYFPCFNDWYKDNIIQFDYENNHIAVFKTNNSQNVKTFQINDKITLNLGGYSGFYDVRKHEKCLFEKSYIEFESTDKMKLLDLLINIGWFKDFYSFAAMNAMPFSEIFLFDNDDYYLKEATYRTIKNQKIKIEDEIRYPNSVMLLYIVEEKFENKDDFDSYHFLFDFQAIEDSFEAIMHKWYEKKDDCEPIIQQLISSVTYHRFIKTSDFLTVIQAIEGYYLRFEKDKKQLENILTDLYTKFKDIQIVDKNKVDFRQVIDSRNHYSHILPVGKKNNVCKDWDLLRLAEQLKPLLLSCILSLIGLENNKIDELLQKYYEFNGNNFVEMP